jgi:hypothetical protein
MRTTDSSRNDMMEIKMVGIVRDDSATGAAFSVSLVDEKLGLV